MFYFCCFSIVKVLFVFVAPVLWATVIYYIRPVISVKGFFDFMTFFCDRFFFEWIGDRIWGIGGG